MPAIHDRGQVNVGDVTWLQFIGARDAVADHVVDTDAAAFGEIVFFSGIAKARRNVTVVQSEFMNNRVELAGRHTRCNVGSNHVENFCVKTTSRTHHLTLSFNQSNLWVSSDHAMSRFVKSWQSSR